MGWKEPRADQEYRDAKETIEDIDKLIAHKKRLPDYIDKVDQTGFY